MNSIKWLHTTAIAMVAVAAGCGVGAHAGHTSGSIAAGTNSLGTPVPGESAGITTYGVTIMDQTGIMLAALGNASKVRDARREAIKRAYVRGARPGDRIRYSVQMDPPTPGLWTSLRIERGSGGGFDYRDVDMQLALGAVHSAIASLGFGIGFRQTTYRRQDQTIGAYLRYEWSGYALPLSMSYRRRVLPMVFASGTFALDVLMPLIALASSEPNKLGYLAALRVEVPVLPVLSPHLQIQKRRAPTGAGEQRIDDWAVTIGVTLAFGKRDPGGPTTVRDGSSCARASAQLVSFMRDGSAPSDRSRDLELALTRRCETDGWTDDARSCIVGVQRRDDLGRCDSTLTPEQRQGLFVELQATLSPATPAPSDASCDAVADRIITVVGTSTEAERVAARALLLRRCSADTWSEPARQCFAGMTAATDMQRCGAQLTVEQRQALDADLRASAASP